MLSHSDIWLAIDRLAQAHGLSPSGLARQSGLDPTTFNKSKRVTREGRQRWPSSGRRSTAARSRSRHRRRLRMCGQGARAGGALPGAVAGRVVPRLWAPVHIPPQEAPQLDEDELMPPASSAPGATDARGPGRHGRPGG